jgi:type VI secretion system secreted protein VgrG
MNEKAYIRSVEGRILMLSMKVDPKKVEELSAEFSRLSRTLEDGEVDINKSISVLLREIYYQYSETYVRSSTSNASSLLGQIRKLASSIALRLKNKATVLDNAAEIYRKNEEDSSKTSKKSDVSSLFGKIGKTVGYFFKYAGKAATNVFSAILGFIFGKGKNSATEAAINLPLNISPLESYLTKNPKKKIEEVKILQQRLKDLGYDIKVDGYYGEETYKIVNLFKDTYGLINEGENKGVVDNQVWQYLFGGLSGELKYNPDEYSELVRIAQIRLKDLGYDVEATGYFDEKMLIAVNEYKEANKLGNTGDWEGVIGAQTWSVMFSAGAVAKIITPDIEEEIETLPPVNDNKVPDEGTGNTSYNITLEAALDKQMKQSPQIQKNGRWVNASRDEVLQYLDPNNYDEGVYKYQFLDLSALAGISEEDMTKYLAGKGILAGKASIYLEAARKYNVSEVYLAAHSSLETGNGTSTLAKGVVVNGVTVYNMYGIGAYDSDPIGAGAQYAYKMGWTTPEKAIEGGAKWISEQYINNASYKQNTLYKMRWNPASPGVHQYATDIGWAVKQTSSIKKMYDNFQNASLKFDIPTYK